MLRGFQEIGHRFPSFQVSWFSLVSAGCHCGETRGNQNAKVLMYKVNVEKEFELLVRSLGSESQPSWWRATNSKKRSCDLHVANQGTNPLRKYPEHFWRQSDLSGRL